MKKIERKVKELEFKILESKVTKEKELVLTEMKKIGIEKLPYSYSALKTFIDPETMDFHYNKHYKGYVDKLNDALSKRKNADVELENIIKNISKYDKTIRNNAGGAFNHALFWNMLTPNPKKLTGELYKKITKEFKTFSNFKKKFETIAKERFGSGWVWLILTKNKKLKIMSTQNQDNPLMNVIEGGGFPLLGLDLWEHAYYLKYRNKRDEYISNFWKVVNWDFVLKLYEIKTDTNLLESKNKTNLVIESHSKDYINYCTPDEEAFFRNLMKIEDIKSRYGGAIYEALKKLDWLEYRPEDLSINRMQGFYKDGKRHILSYLAGNFRAFCMITKSVNSLLRKEGESPILLRNKTLPEQIQAIKKLSRILVSNAEKIFKLDTPFLDAILINLEQSISKGQRVETLSEIRLGNEFGKENVKIKSEFGGESDKLGLDGDLEIDGVKYTMQIKPFTIQFVENDKIVVITTGLIDKYEQDLMVFTNKKETLIFRNQNTEEDINAYKFPINDLIYTLR